MIEPRITQVPPRALKYYPRPVHADARTEEIPTQLPIIPSPKRNVAPFIGGMVIILSIVLFLQMIVIPWITSIQAQWHAGDAKVTSLVANVGHGGESQFLAFDYHGQVTIIEMVGEKATIFTGGTFIGADRLTRIINLSVQDVNHDGKPDLVIQVLGMDGETVLFNTGKSFSWAST